MQDAQLHHLIRDGRVTPLKAVTTAADVSEALAVMEFPLELVAIADEATIAPHKNPDVIALTGLNTQLPRHGAEHVTVVSMIGTICAAERAACLTATVCGRAALRSALFVHVSHPTGHHVPPVHRAHQCSWISTNSEGSASAHGNVIPRNR
ncbi:hypothetical protein ACIBQ5_36530 [Streptomyces massasporeus]|uniref:hypothetical protein n=1 Tax=Streptomyces massasporeus TaxID=67324 RepID=UPI0037BD61D0